MLSIFPLQVFGGLLSAKPEESRDETDSAAPVEGGDKDGGKEGDVREHVVDILFSKGNLSGLQKQASTEHCLGCSLTLVL